MTYNKTKLSLTFFSCLLKQIVFVVILVAGSITRVQAQQGCKDVLEQASDSFDEARQDSNKYQEIINLFKPCSPDDFAMKAHKIRAYELLIVAHHEENSPDSTKRRIINKLIDLDSDYSFKEYMVTDPATVEKIIMLIEDVKEERKKKKSKWLWIGAGGVASAVSAFLLFKPDSPARLPGPPPLPGNK